MSRPFRPSNGTGGEIFMDQWCHHCKRDALFQKSLRGEDGCPIIVAVFAFAIDDPKYPKEWIYGDDGKPECTAFERIGTPDKRDENAAVKDMFA